MAKFNKFLQFNDLSDMRYNVCCPTCKDSYIHHMMVQTIERDEEDKDTGTRYTISGHKLKKNNDAKTGNASLRRGSISIRFSCEHGCDDFVVSFAQHKGHTLVDCEVLKNHGNLWHDEQPVFVETKSSQQFIEMVNKVKDKKVKSLIKKIYDIDE